MQHIFCAKMPGCIFLMCMSCIVFINLLFLGKQEKSTFLLCRGEKKESKNNLVNILHDFYFLQEGRALFHLLLYILQAAHFSFFFNIEKNTSQYPLNVQSFASQIFCLTAVYTIIHTLCVSFLPAWISESYKCCMRENRVCALKNMILS